eukprot:NODE_2441_length_934_cov_258.577929.p1 GENE.NODE_2441_length_934_cov_258.577929~~NODE_2441_length_934_cov_258.577929.p1  ORF type:complete len:243 (-),score=75.43 NODE_2441_length_934_cov_258.577929:190-876(-)
MLPEADVLLHAGDFSMTGQRMDVEGFGDWLRSLDYEQKLVVAGGHDISFHASYYNDRGGKRCHGDSVQDPDDVRIAFLAAGGPTVRYLQDESHVVNGVHVYGTPWQPHCNDWAFNLPRGPALARKWQAIPNTTDILLSHTPPLGRGDLSVKSTHMGCADLLSVVQRRVRPRFAVSGHVHEGYAVSSDGVTQYLNVSSCDEGFRIMNAPLVFDIVPRVQVMSGRRGRVG